MKLSKSLPLLLALLMSACMPLQPGRPTIPKDDNAPNLADSALSVTIEPFASPGRERVVFELGASSATRSGILNAGELKEYVLTATAGQRTHVQTTGYRAPVHFTLTSLSGEITLNNPVGDSWTGVPQASDIHVFTAQVLLPEAGEYVVKLSVPQGAESTRYDVAFTIDNNLLPTFP